jgi:hypothetical protein
MNKKERLLTDMLTNGEGETFALAAAARARRRQAGKKLGLGAGMTAAAFALWFAARPLKPVVRPPATPAYEIISDAELLTQLKDQPVLLVKEHERITGVLFLSVPAERKW